MQERLGQGEGGITTATATQVCVLTASYNWPPVRDPDLISGRGRKVTVILMGTAADPTGAKKPKNLQRSPFIL